MTALRFLVLILVVFLDMPLATAAYCPAVIEDATRLILVLAPDIDEPAASLETYERDNPKSAWRSVSPTEPAVVGASGLAWGLPYRVLARAGELLKVEGDKRAPAGIYRLGAPFGTESSSLPNYTQIEAGRHVCVDEAASPHYNTVVSRETAGAGTAGEEMWTISVYKHGIFVDYPSDPASRAGSCIFLHIWEGPNRGTAGCIALAEDSVRRLQDWSAQPGATAIAILPASARDRFASCLP